MAGYDAIVCGAGPAGSATAALLARDGFRVLLVDRARFPREKACGEYTSPETAQVLQRIGAGDVLERAGARRLRSMRVISAGGAEFSMDYAQPGDESLPHVLATPRRELDAALLDFARACGAQVLEGTKVEAVTMRDGRVGGVVLRRRAPGVGSRESASTDSQLEDARIVIGADGVHSAVVRSLGLAAPLLWPRSIGQVAHYRNYSGLDEWGEMHVGPHGYVGLAPQSGGLVNVGLVMPMAPRFARVSRFGFRGALLASGSNDSELGTRNPQPSSAFSPEERGGSKADDRFDRMVRSFPGVASRLHGAERVTRVRGVGPMGVRVRRTSGPGYLLVGDAAGFFDPFTGEGVYRALRGAELAAQVAHDALLRNDMSARSLARYSRLRHREFAAKEAACRLIQVFVGLPPAMDYAVRRLGARAEASKVLAEVLGDLTDARAALRPRYLWSLLRP